MPHQLPILGSSARQKVACCGRRFGKTKLGLIACVEGHGAGAHRGALAGGTIWWVAPDYPTAAPIWRELRRVCRGAWSDKSEVDRRIEFPGGGSVTVKSAANPESLRGEGLDGLVIDEAASIRDAEVWQEALRPALSDKQGWTIFIGTPKGMNWFSELFEGAGAKPGWARWQAPTADNPLIPPEEIEAARADLGSLQFAQEYLAQFVTAGAGMFRREWFGVVDEAPAGLRWVRCWDLAATEDGKGSKDPDWTAGAKVAKTADGVWYIADVQRVRATPGGVEALVRQTAEVDGRETAIYMEQEPGASGKSVIAHYAGRVLAGYTFRPWPASGSKPERARPVSSAAEAGNVKLVRGAWNKDFLDEAAMFPADGAHDDQIDAVSMAFAAITAKRIALPAAGAGRERPPI